MEVKVLQVAGFLPATHGMRNAKNSWDKGDTCLCSDFELCDDCHYTINEDQDGVPVCDASENFKEISSYTGFTHQLVVIGPNDRELMQKLFAAGPEHRKYDRMIIVWMDITASHIFWQEFDTYKVGTVRNSCSKMHKIHVKPFNYDDFAHEGIDECNFRYHFDLYLTTLEHLRQKFNETQEKKYWKALLEMLPMGFKLTATVMFSYETAANMINQRENHKWYEWTEFVPILKNLPYMEMIREKAVKKSEEDRAMKSVLREFGVENSEQLRAILLNTLRTDQQCIE